MKDLHFPLSWLTRVPIQSVSTLKTISIVRSSPKRTGENMFVKRCDSYLHKLEHSRIESTNCFRNQQASLHHKWVNDSMVIYLQL
jgi:hypothetical protein